MADVFYIQETDPDLLASERSRVESLLKALALKASVKASILEIGSTAVAGVIGKQDLDFLVRVDAADFLNTRKLLDAHFVRNPDQLSNECFCGYRVVSPLDVSIQLAVAGSPYDTFEPFLHILRMNPAILAAYNNLKRLWHGKPMDEYRRAKADFIESVLTRKDA